MDNKENDYYFEVKLIEDAVIPATSRAEAEKQLKNVWDDEHSINLTDDEIIYKGSSADEKLYIVKLETEHDGKKQLQQCLNDEVKAGSIKNYTIFYNRNASKIFASECENDFDFDDLIGNMRCEIKHAVEVERYEENGLSSYGGKIFAEICKTIGRFDIVINLIIRDGYYGGMNLDWSVDITDNTDGDTFELGEIKISNTAENYIQN